MIPKPFQAPLLRKTVESVDTDKASEPQAKKRRISSASGNGVKTIGPQVVPKTFGPSSVPRQPLLAVGNSAVATKALPEGFDRYYNALWYIHV